MLSDRQRDILSLIETEGAQYIERLAARYDVTTQTIRRDTNALCDLGYAKRFHGGVEKPVGARNISVNARAALNSASKQRIASQIATAVPAGSTVFMGIGSTVQFVAAALLDHVDLRVITNNIHVALTLAEAPQIEVHMTGGLLRHDDRDVVGPDALNFFEKFYASHAIIGAGALHPEHGILDFSYSEAQLTAKLLSNARIKFLAADASKWARDASVRVASFSEVTHFFTDNLPEQQQARSALANSGIEVVLCEAAP